MQAITIHFASNCPSAYVGRWEEVCYLMPQLTASGPPTYSASPNQLAFASGISLWKWVMSVCWALWFSVPVYHLYTQNRLSCLIPPSILQLLIHIIPTLPQLITADCNCEYFWTTVPDKSWLYIYPGSAIRCLFEDTRNIQYDTIQIPKSESEITVAPSEQSDCL